MATGFRVHTDSWLKDFEEAKGLAQEVLQLIQDRNINNAGGGPEASRKTATARRKIGTLGTLIEKLLKWLDSQEGQQLSEAERNRRRDLLYDLRNRREQMQISLKRTPAQANRDALLEGSSSGPPAPRETEQTAELDNQGLLGLQQQLMKNQDTALETMEKTVINTKHIALAIGEEVDLHTRLLDDLEEGVEVQQTRMKAATLKVKQLLKNTSHWKGGFCIFILIVTLVVLLVLVAKLHRLFGG